MVIKFFERHKKAMRRIVILLIVIVVYYICAVISFHIKVSQYDEDAALIEKFSFISTSQNIVRCSVQKDSLNARYVCNSSQYRETDVIELKVKPFSYYYGILDCNGKGSLFKTIGSQFQSLPFYQHMLPYKQLSFIHPASYNKDTIVYDSYAYLGKQLEISFDKAYSYDEVLKIFEDSRSYSVKFCWVDTYDPDEISDDDIFSLGIPWDNDSDFKQAYGFMCYDRNYAERIEIENPDEKFVQILKENKIVEGSYKSGSYMSGQIEKAKNALLTKYNGSFTADDLEIIGVVLDKKDGKEFTDENVEWLLKYYDCIKHVVAYD